MESNYKIGDKVIYIGSSPIVDIVTVVMDTVVSTLNLAIIVKNKEGLEYVANINNILPYTGFLKDIYDV